MLTQTQIEYFEKVYELGVIAQAAEQLYVSRPVVSKVIRGIEQKMGQPLFVRAKSGVTPTWAGEQVHRMICEMTNRYQVTLKRIRANTEPDRIRELRMGVTAANVEKVYDIIICPFTKMCPDIKIRIIEFSPDEMWEELASDRIDIAIAPGESRIYENFDSIDLFPAKMVIGIQEDYPLAQKLVADISDLDGLPLAFLGTTIPFEGTLKTCSAALCMSLDVIIKTSSLSLLRRLTEQGDVCTIAPLYLMEGWNHVKTIPLAFLHAPPVKVCWNKVLEGNSTVTDFLKYVWSRAGCS